MVISLSLDSCCSSSNMQKWEIWVITTNTSSKLCTASITYRNTDDYQIHWPKCNLWQAWSCNDWLQITLKMCRYFRVSSHTCPTLIVWVLVANIMHDCFQRLTKSVHGDQRDDVIASYVSNDLLACTMAPSIAAPSSQNGTSGEDENTTYRAAIFRLLKSGTLSAQYLARLFNGMASIKEG